MCYQDPSCITMLSEIMQSEDQKYADILYYIQHMTKPSMLYAFMKIPDEVADKVIAEVKQSASYFVEDFIACLKKLMPKHYFDAKYPISTNYTSHYDFFKAEYGPERKTKKYSYEGISWKEFER